MKKFHLGVAASTLGVLVAIPLITQISLVSAARNATETAKKMTGPTSACVQALAAKDTAFLSTIDANIALQKTATQAHKDALTAAAALTDDGARTTAFMKAEKEFMTAMAKIILGGEDKKVAEAIRTACGGEKMSGSGKLLPPMQRDMKPLLPKDASGALRANDSMNRFKDSLEKIMHNGDEQKQPEQNDRRGPSDGSGTNMKAPEGHMMFQGLQMPEKFGR